MKFLTRGRPLRDEYCQRAARNLLQAGLLSEQRQGNWDARASLTPQSHAGFVLDDREFYFTTESLCETFCRLEKDLKPEGDGNYIVPDKISVEEWRVILAKCSRGNSPRIITQLVERDVLTNVSDSSGECEGLVVACSTKWNVGSGKPRFEEHLVPLIVREPGSVARGKDANIKF